MIMILMFGFLGTHTEVESSVQEGLLESVQMACICGGEERKQRLAEGKDKSP